MTLTNCSEVMTMLMPNKDPSLNDISDELMRISIDLSRMNFGMAIDALTQLGVRIDRLIANDYEITRGDNDERP